MLGKNQIESMRGVEALRTVDILDLHENRISKIDFVSKLQQLRVLNLSNNSITVLENISNMRALTELNLRSNKIAKIRDTSGLPSLQKLYLSFNAIEGGLDNLRDTPVLRELTLENNPIEQRETFMQVGSLEWKIASLNNKLGETPVTTSEKKGEDDKEGGNVPTISQSTPVKEETKEGPLSSKNATKQGGTVFGSGSKSKDGAQKKAECNVIRIIKQEWDREVERLANKKQHAA